MTVDVPAGVAEDAGGAANEAAARFSIAADLLAPSAAVTSGAEAPVSEEFAVTVTFSEPVTGFAMSDLEIANGSATRMASLSDGTQHTVYVAPDLDAEGEVTVTVPAGVAADAADNPNTASAPFAIALLAGEVDAAETGLGVTGAAVTSSPAEGSSYAVGEEIDVTVQFDTPVTVDNTNGTPTIGLWVGGKTRRAGYGGGSGTAALAFVYTVTADDDGAAAGVRVIGNSLKLNGGTIQGDTGTDVDTAFDVAPVVAVADARAREGVDETIGFTVTLSPSSGETVTVDYETADGTAVAFEDYVAVSGTLLFRPGDTEVTVLLDVLDDARDEGEETFTLRLSNALGASLGDAEATGTIANTDPLPKAWLARFGRTVAGHVVDAVSVRLTEISAPDSHVTIGGRRLPLDAGSAGAAAWPESPDAAGRLEDAWPWDGWGHDGRLAERSRAVTDRELLLGSSFRLSLGPEENGAVALGAHWTAWGRAAATRFDGRDGPLSLSGDVTTGLLGVDGEWERWIAGVAVSHSAGDGSYGLSGDRGKLESSLTGVHPYVHYEASERLSAWGVLGYGTGGLTHAGDGEAPIETDIGMTMGAFGVRGALLPANDTGGFELAARSDALVTRTASESADGMMAGEADTSRLRLILEGSRTFGVGEGGTLTPSLEVGLRHDGGDAETGTGVELGAGLRYADPARGLTMEVNARALIAHEETGYEEWGASGFVRLDPGASGHGLSLTLSPAWGATSSGVERLWSLRDTAGLAANGGFEPGRRLEAELGYGQSAFGGSGVMTPYASLGLSDGIGRTLRTGVRWTLGPDFTLGLKGTRREAANDDAPEHSVELMFRIRVPVGAVAARSRAAPGRFSAAALPAPPPETSREPSGAPHYRVQLGAFSKNASAVRVRTVLAGELADLLTVGGLALTVDDSKKDGLSRVVLANDFVALKAAAAVCTEIEARGKDCYVTRFAQVMQRPGRTRHDGGSDE